MIMTFHLSIIPLYPMHQHLPWLSNSTPLSCLPRRSFTPNKTWYDCRTNRPLGGSPRAVGIRSTQCLRWLSFNWTEDRLYQTQLAALAVGWLFLKFSQSWPWSCPPSCTCVTLIWIRTISCLELTFARCTIINSEARTIRLCIWVLAWVLIDVVFKVQIQHNTINTFDWLLEMSPSKQFDIFFSNQSIFHVDHWHITLKQSWFNQFVPSV